MYRSSPTILMRKAALTSSATAHVGDWVDVSSGSVMPLTNPVAFWFRMQASGSPTIQLLVDYSPFKTLPVSANAGFSTNSYDPNSNYVSVELIAAGFSTKWNGVTVTGGWTQVTCPAALLVPFVSIRYGIVVSTANISSADLVMLRGVGAY